jgi:hypothetical protein
MFRNLSISDKISDGGKEFKFACSVLISLLDQILTTLTTPSLVNLHRFNSGY